MHIGVYRFQPTLILTLIAAALFILFVWLGNWQLNRANEKRLILRNYDHRIQEPPSELPLPLSDATAWRYRRVRITGRFDEEKQFLLDNQVNRGQAGFNVLTPLKLLHKEQAVLIDRGWIPLNADRRQLPDVSVATDVVSLEGVVYVPYGRGVRLGGLDEASNQWPRLIEYLDFEAMSNRLGYPLAPLTIRLDPKSPHGYRRTWKAVPITPQTHTAYALQWFTFAAVMMVIYLALSLKRRESSASDPENDG
jgi:surfeit locus 1 family protein